jgi:hypothetical protein
LGWPRVLRLRGRHGEEQKADGEDENEFKEKYGADRRRRALMAAVVRNPGLLAE